MTLHLLNDNDVRILKEIVRDYRGRDKSRGANPYLTSDQQGDIPGPDVYIALIPEDGLPALSLGPPDTPGVAQCDLYRIQQPDVGGTPDLVPMAVDPFTVYNFGTNAIAPGEYVRVTRTKWGAWIADAIIDHWQTCPGIPGFAVGDFSVLTDADYVPAYKDGCLGLLEVGQCTESVNETGTGTGDVDTTADPGDVKMTTAFDNPAGWLTADGTVVNRTTYTNLFDAITDVQSGSMTNGNATITGLTDTSQLCVGTAVEGSGISSGTTITSINGATEIEISNNATATQTANLTFLPFGGGDGSTTFDLPDLRGRSPIGVGAAHGSISRYGLAEEQGAENHTLSVSELPSHSHPGSSTTANQLTAAVTAQPGASYGVFNGAATVTVAAQGGDSGHETRHPVLGVRFIIKT